MGRHGGTRSSNNTVVSVEVWDGTEGPVVWHKLEETNRLSLQRVLQTINTTAFEDSEYGLYLLSYLIVIFLVLSFC